MNSFAEGSIDSVFRLVSDAQFTNYSDDITASDSTSLIIVRNSSKHGGRQFSSLKSKRTALEEGILPHTNSRSLRDHRRHNHSSRLKKLNESLEPDFLPETILEAAEIEKNSVKKVSNMSADTGPKLLGRSRTLCVARETRSKKGSLISHRSLLPEVQVTVEVESPRRNWFERFIFWAFGLGNLLNNATSEGTTKVSKSSQQTARSFSISSSSSSSNEDESKKDANPIPVPKVTVTSEEGLHKGSTDTTASDVSFRMRSSSGTGKDFAHGNGSE